MINSVVNEGIYEVAYQFGLDDLQLRSSYSGFNNIYVLKDGLSKKKYVLREHKKGGLSSSQITSELSWLKSISDLQNISVPTPVEVGGHSSKQCSRWVASDEDGINYSLLHWIKGDALDEKSVVALSGAHIRKVGKILGTLHSHSESWCLPEGFDRPRDNMSDLISDPDYKENIHRVMSILGFESRTVDFVEYCMALVDDYINSQPFYGVIHNDVTPWNLLLRKGKLNLIDFDDCAMGYAYCDMSRFFLSIISLREMDPRSFFKYFSSGYSKSHSPCSFKLFVAFVVLMSFEDGCEYVSAKKGTLFGGTAFDWLSKAAFKLGGNEYFFNNLENCEKALREEA